MTPIFASTPTPRRRQSCACKMKLGILRALAGTGWGCQKELLLKTYKTFIEPSMNYAAAVWAPNASDSSFDSLQTVQNSALRIATGCHKSSTVEHLHTEAKYPLVKDHLEMLSSQHIASALRPTHPSHTVVTAPHGPRSMKETLGHKCENAVAPYLTNGIVDPSKCRSTLKKIHTDAISASIKKLSVVNPVLGATPPLISDSEKRLTRFQRTTLAQLCSGSCRLLNDYKVTLGHIRSALCPECLFQRHTVRHIFQCDAAPTTLTPRDLWVNPATVVDFLSSLPSFSSLLPPNPPPPPPPPQPPDSP